MNKRRVVVTGLGVVTSLGESVDEMWENVCAGKSGIGPIRRWDCSKYPVRIGGECYSFDLARYQEEATRHSGGDGERTLHPKRMDRFGQFAVAASLSFIAFQNRRSTSTNSWVRPAVGFVISDTLRS